MQNISLVKTKTMAVSFQCMTKFTTKKKTEIQTRVCVCVCVCRYIIVYVPEKVWKDTWLYQTATVITSGKWFCVTVC